MRLMGSLASWKPHKQAHLVSAMGQTGYKHEGIRMKKTQFVSAENSQPGKDLIVSLTI